MIPHHLRDAAAIDRRASHRVRRLVGGLDCITHDLSTNGCGASGRPVARRKTGVRRDRGLPHSEQTRRVHPKSHGMQAEHARVGGVAEPAALGNQRGAIHGVLVRLARQRVAVVHQPDIHDVAGPGAKHRATMRPTAAQHVAEHANGGGGARRLHPVQPIVRVGVGLQVFRAAARRRRRRHPRQPVLLSR